MFKSAVFFWTQPCTLFIKSAHNLEVCVVLEDRAGNTEHSSGGSSPWEREEETSRTIQEREQLS